jgi:hypothetical protein
VSPVPSRPVPPRHSLNRLHSGFAFFQLGDSQSDILATIGVLFFVSTQPHIYSTVPIPLITPFPLQRAVMIRERSAGLYRTSSFFLAKVVLEIPNAIVPRLPYYVLLYFM